ncbi:MAG: patatin-like protein [Chlorobiaceae bacterium]|nr:patatin-like protein [Chlorobiaceae bacterium]NTW74804.1 patatin-like protein [Chlorobiaceae bacterium]
MGQSQEKITQEIRFAVVMYGGVSLAIYMNGIAQELLSLVRSTSSKSGGTASDNATTKVYQEVARYLSTPKDASKDTFEHRFVVDIISGTSAGGINGVCLAKGLVRGLDNLKELEMTWVKHGDIDTLLNDRKSQPEIYSPKEPKTSLFNSQRMYGMLLDAFNKMESAATREGRIPQSHVESMDLFVTATDLRGLQLPLLLSDGQANERIHKHVFPFSYREHEFDLKGALNHFDGQFDTMLALASRCTSSFPTAFEPVRIEDIRLWLDQQKPEEHLNFQTNLGYWKKLFFSSYEEEELIVPLDRREFADGGYLDNRPFGHAIQAIHAREADCPIYRKLLFIDPVPETLEERRKLNEISFVKNSVLAAQALPGYETIRKELDDLARRNDWIRSVNGILEELKPQIIKQHKSIVFYHFDEFYRKHPSRFKPEERKLAKLHLLSARSGSAATEHSRPADVAVGKFWEFISKRGSSLAPQEKIECELVCPKFDGRDLRDMTRLIGKGYAAFHFTRRENMTKELSLMIIRAMNAERRREVSSAVEKIVTAWRMANFAPNRKDLRPEGASETENTFFRRYDIDFRIRRMNFFRNAIESAMTDKSATVLYFGLTPNEEFVVRWSDELKTEITGFYNVVVKALRSLYRLRALLRSGTTRNPLTKTAESLRERIEARLAVDGPGSVKGVDGMPVLPGDFNGIAELFDKSGHEMLLHREPFSEFFNGLMQEMHLVVMNGSPGEATRQVCDTEACNGTEAVSSLVIEAFARLSIRYPELAGRMRYAYDYGYDLIDASSLPLFSGGEYGEGTIVETFRISPADTMSLWKSDERTQPKIAGLSVGAFGGFLDQQWRRNDIMWGRLDAAERIITALMPAEGEERRLREELILKAQHAILLETMIKWKSELAHTRNSVPRDDTQYNILDKIHAALDNSPVIMPREKNEPVQEPPWKSCFLTEYNYDGEIELERNLRRVGRSSSILSSMVERLDEGEGLKKKTSSYLKKLSWVLLAMLDFSTPKKLKAVLTHYWLQLATLMSLTIMALGALFGKVSSLQNPGHTTIAVGGALLGIVGIVWLIRYGIETFIIRLPVNYKTRRVLRFIEAILVAIIFVVLVLAAEALIDSWNSLVATYGKSFLSIAKHQLEWLVSWL